MSNLETVSAEAVSDGGANPNQSPIEAPKEAKAEPASEAVIEETKAEESSTEVEKVEKQDRFAAKFAALTRKEKALRQQAKELEEQSKTLSQRLKELEEKDNKFKTREQLKREQPLKYLEEEGLSYEELTQALLNDGKIPEDKKQERIIASLQDEIKKLHDKLSEREQREKEEREQQEKQTAEQKVQSQISAFKSEISEFLGGAEEEKYELVKSGLFADVTDPVEAIYDIIREHYEETKANSPDEIGEILEISQAADLLEQFLEGEAEKLAKTKKAKAKFIPPKEEPEQIEAQSNSPKTLENAHSSTVPDRQGKKLSDEERIAEAANLIRWNKTQ